MFYVIHTDTITVMQVIDTRLSQSFRCNEHFQYLYRNMNNIHSKWSWLNQCYNSQNEHQFHSVLDYYFSSFLFWLNGIVPFSWFLFNCLISKTKMTKTNKTSFYSVGFSMCAVGVMCLFWFFFFYSCFVFYFSFIHIPMRCSVDEHSFWFRIVVFSQIFFFSRINKFHSYLCVHYWKLHAPTWK